MCIRAGGSAGCRGESGGWDLQGASAGGVGATGASGPVSTIPGPQGATGPVSTMPGPTGPSGVFSTAELTHHHMNFSLSGGGTLTVKVVSNTVRIRWDTRVLALPLMGKAGSTNYNIDCPASGTTGTGQIIDADGIPMGANTSVFSALYYQLPTASTSISTLVGNFRVISTLNTVDNIDPSWVLLAVLNTDASQALVKWQAGGVVLPPPDNGQQIQWGSNAPQLGRGATKIPP